jgi:UDP-N-acetyl-D-glucosamine dehydrogenase
MTADATATAATLIDRLDEHAATVAVIGMGYVGLPLAGQLHEAGLSVIGFDTDAAKVERLQRGDSYIDYHGDLVTTLAASDRFCATADPIQLADAHVILLCVPTPLDDEGDPDLGAVESSTDLIAANLTSGQLIILESTTWPGTTQEVVLPRLQATARARDLTFLLAYSPERVDPGRDLSPRAIPKVVGGIDAASCAAAAALYRLLHDEVVEVSSCAVAESAKLLENIYRAVNIAMVNELKVVFDAMDIDIWEVLDAASTKPFGFQKFTPGPGLGGHCIPIDPFYLAWKARQHGVDSRFIELAGTVNEGMPAYVVHKTTHALAPKELDGASILVIGVAYKPDIDDNRQTPAAPIITMLQEAGATVKYHDPHIPHFPPMRRWSIDLDSVDLTPDLLAAQDAVIIITAHSAIDWAMIGRHAPLVIDTRHVMASVDAPAARIVNA